MSSLSLDAQLRQSIGDQRRALDTTSSVDLVRTYIVRCNTWLRLGHLPIGIEPVVKTHLSTLKARLVKMEEDVSLLHDPNFLHVNVILSFLLRNEGKLAEEGLVSASGNRNVYQPLVEGIKRGDVFDLSSYSGVNLYKAMGLLIGDLSMPIIPTKWTLVLGAASRSKDESVISERWDRFPKANRLILEKLLQLALEVHRVHRERDVTLGQITKMIGPLLFVGDEEQELPEKLAELLRQLKLTEWLLQRRVNMVVTKRRSGRPLPTLPNNRTNRAVGYSMPTSRTKPSSEVNDL